MVGAGLFDERLEGVPALDAGPFGERGRGGKDTFLVQDGLDFLAHAGLPWQVLR